MYVQLFVFTRLTSGHFASLNVPSHERVSISTGEESRKKTSKHILSHEATAKREAFSFFVFSQYLTIFPQHTSTETHCHAPARTQFVVI